ncbi:hypothetical protein SEA_OCTOBIEN14_134 [Gordonia phage Octobien14]|uniref:Uncharacterized protein n=1 Tax=Gordonia phage Octobien14 TaxID=2483673 RepID=A0A3G3MAJ3_9CAUD|nr:hypothetical protein L3Y22_gp110 [Gordonia phage Octobien14]AYR03269.1 hypothetical protein SEA_OCTOBIEN14_134 [Gordonia phage Octobien14]
MTETMMTTMPVNPAIAVSFTPWHANLTITDHGSAKRITAADGRYWDVNGDVITADRGNIVPTDCKLGAALLWAANNTSKAA